MGLNQPFWLFELLRPHFLPKSTKHGLKWELASFSNYRVFENHPMFCIFLVWWRRSNIVWRGKIFSFRRDNFWKFIIFDLHWQYVYEMKAENILKSNLQSKSIICYNFFWKNWILKNFRKIFLKFFFLEIKFFEIFFIQPQKFIFFTCFKHQKWNLHEGLTLLTSSKTKQQAFEVAKGWFNPTPVF